jgi:predicted metal-dependent phosphoesterase TrpH
MFFVDLHIHSKYSYDSLIEPSTILKVARRVKLNAIAIVDHNTITGAIVARKICKEDSLVIIGSEITTNLGDIIGLFLNEEIRSRNVFEVIDEVKSQDGLILLPHPFRTVKDIFEIKEVIPLIDLIEGYNSRHPITFKQFSQLKMLTKPLVAGSDAHFTREIGLCRTVVHKEINTEEDLRKALLEEVIDICGSPSPSYLEFLSQLIKGLKRKDLKLIGWSLFNLAVNRAIKNQINGQFK